MTKSKRLISKKFTSNKRIDINRYDKKVRSRITSKRRRKYLARIMDRELYLLIGFESLEEYVKDVLSGLYQKPYIDRYLKYVKITTMLRLKLTDYSEGSLRPLTPFIGDHKVLANVWDFVCNITDSQTIKPRHIQEGIISYQEHVLMHAASKDEKKTVKKILELMDTLPNNLRKQLGKQLSKQQ